MAHLLLRLVPPKGQSARQELEDLVQDVFLSLWDRDGYLLRRWDAERGRTLESYVRLVSRSRALDVLRSRRRGPWHTHPTDPAVLEGLAGSSDATSRLAARENLRALQTKLRAHLSVRDQSLFVALFVEERSAVEVAATMGMSTDAVYQFGSRLRRKILPALMGGAGVDPKKKNSPKADLISGPQAAASRRE
ncbi:MAG: sigma-70 family RNA polymerase sigma factor [Nannocystaceae bacterium]|nr:sigma-70 family RNA polymerase sigma factor [Nannocystaceae bacterium]